MIKLTKMNNQVNNMAEDQDGLKPVSMDLTKSVLMEQDAGVHLTFCLVRSYLYLKYILILKNN